MRLLRCACVPHAVYRHISRYLFSATVSGKAFVVADRLAEESEEKIMLRQKAELEAAAKRDEDEVAQTIGGRLGMSASDIAALDQSTGVGDHESCSHSRDVQMEETYRAAFMVCSLFNDINIILRVCFYVEFYHPGIARKISPITGARERSDRGGGRGGRCNNPRRAH